MKHMKKIGSSKCINMRNIHERAYNMEVVYSKNAAI